MQSQPRYKKDDKIGGRYLVHQALTGGMSEVHLKSKTWGVHFAEQVIRPGNGPCRLAWPMTMPDNGQCKLAVMDKPAGNG